MNRLLLLISVLSLTLVSNNVMAAGKPPKAVDIPITQEISDSDVNSVPYYIQSDGLEFTLTPWSTLKEDQQPARIRS